MRLSAARVLSRGNFVVVEGDGEEGLFRRVLRRKGLRWVRRGQRAEGGVVERVDRARTDDAEIRDRALLVHVERDDDVPLHRHRGVRDEPVALHLRDEAANPRSELDALRVELNLGSELTAAAALIVELLVLHV